MTEATGKYQQGWRDGAEWQRARIADLMRRLARGKQNAGVLLASLLAEGEPDPAVQAMFTDGDAASPPVPASERELPEVVELDEHQGAYMEWCSLQSGVDTPHCQCGHDGMGPAWHTSLCPGAVTALSYKLRESMEQASRLVAERKAMAALLGVHDPDPERADLVAEMRRTLDAYGARRAEDAALLASRGGP